MKLVDVEEVHEIFNWSHQKPPYSKKTIHRYIDMAREVEAVPVIRCKDCKHYADECCDRYADETLGYVHSTQEYGYCWVAERKEE